MVTDKLNKSKWQNNGSVNDRYALLKMYHFRERYQVSKMKI